MTPAFPATKSTQLLSLIFYSDEISLKILSSYPKSSLFSQFFRNDFRFKYKNEINN